MVPSCNVILLECTTTRTHIYMKTEISVRTNLTLEVQLCLAPYTWPPKEERGSPRNDLHAGWASHHKHRIWLAYFILSLCWSPASDNHLLGLISSFFKKKSHGYEAKRVIKVHGQCLTEIIPYKHWRMWIHYQLMQTLHSLRLKIWSVFLIGTNTLSNHALCLHTYPCCYFLPYICEIFTLSISDGALQSMSYANG